MLLIRVADRLQKGKGCPLCGMEGTRIEGDDAHKVRYRCDNCGLDYVSIRKPKMAGVTVKPVEGKPRYATYEDLRTDHAKSAGALDGLLPKVRADRALTQRHLGWNDAGHALWQDLRTGQRYEVVG